MSKRRLAEAPDTSWREEKRGEKKSEKSERMGEVAEGEGVRTERKEAARSRGGLFGDRRRRRAKNEQNGSEGTRLELYLALPYLVLLLASSHLTSPHLA